MKRFLIAVMLLLTLTACGPGTPSGEEEISQLPEPTQEELAAAQIEALLENMTTEEIVGQLFFPRCPPVHAAEDLQTYHLGGYVLFSQDMKDLHGHWLTAEQISANLRAYQEAAKIPLLLGVDEEGGTVVRVSANPRLRSRKFQSPRKLFASGGMAAILDETAEKDALLASLGINVNLAPVADLSQDPSDFIYDRSFGRYPRSTSEYVRQVTTAMADDNMGSVLKHFPGYGRNVDTHTGIAVDNRPLEQFRSSDFLPFIAGVEAGGAKTAVMVSHNIITAVDPELPASLSPALHQVLREELGGLVVMTDDLNMDAVAAYAEDHSVAVMALEAGNDLIVTSDYQEQIPPVLEAVEDGRLSLEKLKCACRRVLTWKQALGLLPPIAPEN